MQAEYSAIAQILSMICVVLAGAFAFWKFSGAQHESVMTQLSATRALIDDKTAAMRQAIEERVASLRAETQLRVEGVANAESKSRHDLRNDVLRITAAHDAQIEEMRRAMVRREDMNALEARLMTAVTELRNKTDALLEKFSVLAVVKDQSERNGAALTRIHERLDQLASTTPRQADKHL